MSPSRVAAVAALIALGCHPEGDGPGTRPEPEAPPYAGARPLSRLNGPEYDRTIRDLFGIEYPFSATFPPDEIAFGFDNQAAALSTTATHLEAWEAAAGRVGAELLAVKDERTQDYGAEGEGPGPTYVGVGRLLDDAYLLADGTITVPLTVEGDGRFELTVRAAGHDVSGPPILDVLVDGEVVDAFTLTDREYGELSSELVLESGVHSVVLTVRNPYTAGTTARSVGVDWVRVRGPLDPEVGRSTAWKTAVGCAPDGEPDDACVEDALRKLGGRAWRRPLAADELGFLVEIARAARAAGSPADEALAFAIQAMLLSPEFLYRYEPAPERGVRELGGYELATRLAAFLWSSTPDDELLAAAERGWLSDPALRDEQVERMLADPRADALVDNLAGQWFDLRDLDRATPDAAVFPNFDPALRRAMKQEMAFHTAGFFREGRPFRELVTRETTVVDQRLAAHYRVGFDEAAGGWQETYTDRLGVFGTAGFLTVHARPAKASAVSRGKWILDNLLCSPTPPPPQDVDMSIEFDPEGGSVRQQEEAARSGTTCQACHARMDGYGFALAGYDATGAERATDELGYPIDSLVTIEGTEVANQVELAELVGADPRLDRCAVEKTLTYAVGRPLVREDDPEIDAATRAFVDGGSTFSALARAVASSRPFLARDPNPSTGEAP